MDNLLGHVGFGNPQGRFWFVGIEEYGEGTLKELEWRLQFDEVDDLNRVHVLWGTDFAKEEPFNPQKLVPTWAAMSKFVLRLTGEPNCSDNERVRDYLSDHLGQVGDQTFLTEMLPLPVRGTDPNLWPYSAR